METEHKHEHKHKHEHHRRHHHHHHHGHSGATPEVQDDEFPIFDPPVTESTTVNNDNSTDNRSYHHHSHDHTAQATAVPVDGVAAALRRILEAVNGLPSRYMRHLALGHAIARLTEQSRIGGISDVVGVALSEANRYQHVDDLERTTPNWNPSIK